MDLPQVQFPLPYVHETVQKQEEAGRSRRKQEEARGGRIEAGLSHEGLREVDGGFLTFDFWGVVFPAFRRLCLLPLPTTPYPCP